MTLEEAKQKILATKRAELAGVAKAQGPARREKLESLVPALVGLVDPTGVAAARGAAALKQLGTWVAGLSEHGRFEKRLAELDALDDEEQRVDAWAAFLAAVLQAESADRDQAIAAIYDVNVETAEKIDELRAAVEALRAERKQVDTQMLPPGFPEGPEPDAPPPIGPPWLTEAEHTALTRIVADGLFESRKDHLKFAGLNPANMPHKGTDTAIASQDLRLLIGLKSSERLRKYLEYVADRAPDPDDQDAARRVLVKLSGPP